MADEVSISTPLTTNDVTFSFTETSSPVSVSSPISVSDVLVSVNEADNSVSVSVTDTITDVAVTVDNVTQPVSVSVTEQLTNVSVEVSTGSAEWTESFDTISRNLSGYPYAINYVGSDISSIVFNKGSSFATKTYNYTAGKLTSVVLSGDVPVGVNTTKTINYTAGVASSVTYS